MRLFLLCPCLYLLSSHPESRRPSRLHFLFFHCVCALTVNQLEGVLVADVGWRWAGFPRYQAVLLVCLWVDWGVPVTECRLSTPGQPLCPAGLPTKLAAPAPAPHLVPVPELQYRSAPDRADSPGMLSIFRRFLSYSLLFHVKFREIMSLKNL